VTTTGSDAPAAAIRAAGGTEASTVALNDAVVGLRPSATGWEVLAWAPGADSLPAGLSGTGSEMARGTLLVGPADGANAAALRNLVPWLRPRQLGQATSAGTGDRLGIATPGHVAAFRANPGVAPVLAQQSARELERMGRTFADVVDAATYGALASGWRNGYGADADHLKTIADADGGITAGCTLFTADPIDLVPNLAADAPAAAIEPAFRRVSWTSLEDDEASLGRRYPARLELESGSLELPRPALRAAAARFAPAVAHVTAMYRHLVAERGATGFEFEVAVDEIAFRTTHVDHVYLATELHRLGVRWVSLAPRFVGRFEKGVDFLGDPFELARDVEVHSAIARVLGDYKVSVHSGSDKYSVYEGIARATRGRVHLKTSGTSYLAALSVIAATDPPLMSRIWRTALRAYSTARASYHVSADLATVPGPDGLRPAQLAALLVEPGTREILHVTYGAVLNGDGADADLSAAVRASVWRNREGYWRSLEDHIGRHLRPFSGHDEELRRHRDG
jgi:hypothetical protein